MDQDEREIASRIKFSLAEAAVIRDHLEDMMIDTKDLITAVAKNDGGEVMRTWNRMGDHMNYVGTMLNLKGSAAAKQYIAERGDD